MQPVLSPPLTMQPVLPPLLTMQPVLSPLLTIQPVLSPPLTMQPVLSPLLTMQPVLSPLLTMQPIIAFLLTNLLVLSPLLTMQPVLSPLLPMQPLTNHSREFSQSFFFTTNNHPFLFTCAYVTMTCPVRVGMRRIYCCASLYYNVFMFLWFTVHLSIKYIGTVPPPS